MSNVIDKQTERQTYATKAISRFCKVTDTHDFHGLQLVVIVIVMGRLNI